MQKPKTVPRQQIDYDLIKGLGNWTPSAFTELLSKAGACEDNRVILMACARLSSLEGHPGRQLQPSDYEATLNALASSPHPLAAYAIEHLARNAQLARLRYEALKRLGPLATTVEAQNLLRAYATEEQFVQHISQNDNLTADSFRIAAIESISQVPKPSDADVDCVIEIIHQELPGKKMPIFQASCNTLSATAKPKHIPRMITMAKADQPPVMRLWTLSSLREFTKNQLASEAHALGNLLTDALRSHSPDGPLTEHISLLAKKIPSKPFIKGLADFARDNNSSRTTISSAALGSYEPPDAATSGLHRASRVGPRLLETLI